MIKEKHIRLHVSSRKKQYLCKTTMNSVGKLHVVARGQHQNSGPWANDVKEGTGTCVFTERLGDGKYLALTCAHVVENAHPSLGVKVSVGNHESRHEATVLGINREADAAVVEVNLPQEATVSTASLGDDRLLAPGDGMTALGYSLGYPHAKKLPVNLEWRNRTNGLLELDAAANPGMSGGAVLKDGKVVGLIRSKLGNAEGMTFATPASHVQRLLDGVRDKQSNVDLSLPFKMVINNSDYMDFHEISDHGEGVLAHSVKDPGLSEGDIVLQVKDPYDQKFKPITYNGNVRVASGTRVTKKVDAPIVGKLETDLMSISDILQQVPYNSPAEFKVITPTDKNKKPRTVLINPSGSTKSLDRPPSESFGMYVKEMPAKDAPVFVTRALTAPDQGPITTLLVVENTYPGSFLKINSPIGPGHIVRTVNDRRVNTIDDYREALSNPLMVNGQSYVQLGTICGEGCQFNTAVRLDKLKQEIPLIQSLGLNVNQRWDGTQASEHADETPKQSGGDAKGTDINALDQGKDTLDQGKDTLDQGKDTLDQDKDILDQGKVDNKIEEMVMVDDEHGGDSEEEESEDQYNQDSLPDDDLNPPEPQDKDELPPAYRVVMTETSSSA